MRGEPTGLDAPALRSGLYGTTDRGGGRRMTASGRRGAGGRGLPRSRSGRASGRVVACGVTPGSEGCPAACCRATRPALDGSTTRSSPRGIPGGVGPRPGPISRRTRALAPARPDWHLDLPSARAGRGAWRGPSHRRRSRRALSNDLRTGGRPGGVSGYRDDPSREERAGRGPRMPGNIRRRTVRGRRRSACSGRPPSPTRSAALRRAGHRTAGRAPSADLGDDRVRPG